MDRWIETPSAVQRLIMAWRAPPGCADRLRWAVGEVRRSADGATFQYYPESLFRHVNWNKKGNVARSHADLSAAGFAGFPAFKFSVGDQQRVFVDALGALSRRLPPTNRDDYAQYLSQYRIPASVRMDTLQLIGATEARLPGDGFEFVDPLDEDAVRVDVVVEIEGVHYRKEAAAKLRLGQRLILRREPENEFDPCAVMVLHEEEHVGYISRFQAPAVGRWMLKSSVGAHVVRLNGTTEKPRAYAMLRLGFEERALAA